MKIDLPASGIQDSAVLVGKPGRFSRAEGDEKGFSQMLKEGMDRVNTSLNKADELASGLAAGRDVDVPDAMIAITRAEISFKMFLQIRNKALSAYEEIMRLQF